MMEELVAILESPKILWWGLIAAGAMVVAALLKGRSPQPEGSSPTSSVPGRNEKNTQMPIATIISVVFGTAFGVGILSLYMKGGPSVLHLMPDTIEEWFVPGLIMALALMGLSFIFEAWRGQLRSAAFAVGLALAALGSFSLWKGMPLTKEPVVMSFFERPPPVIICPAPSIESNFFKRTKCLVNTAGSQWMEPIEGQDAAAGYRFCYAAAGNVQVNFSPSFQSPTQMRVSATSGVVQAEYWLARGECGPNGALAIAR